MKQRIALLTVLLLVAGNCALAQSSPFMRAQQTKAKTAVAEKDLKFALTGIIKLGDTPMVCITEVAENRSQWIKLGESSSGITVTGFDAENNAVSISHAGQSMNLVLKVPTFDPSELNAYQPMGALPSAGVAVPVAVTNEEKEVEARMLVSDLLEIGLIQRKAYQKAKAEQVAEEREARKSE